MRVSLKNLGVFTLSLIIMWCSAPNALADSPDYLAGLQVLNSDEFVVGRLSWLIVKVTNGGTLTWPSVASDPSNPVRISYHWIDTGGKVSIQDGLRTELPRNLVAGESLVMRVSIRAPAIPGKYSLVLDLLQEHVTWFADQGSPPLTMSAVEVHETGGLTWERGRVLFIVAGAILLLLVVGVGTRRFLAPDLSVVLSPLLGIGVIVVLSYYGFLFGMSMTQAKWAILTLGAGTTVAAVVARKPAAHLCRWESMWLIFLTVVMLFVTLLPLWDFGRPSSIQNTYSSYFVTMSEYWKHHNLRDIPALDPHQPLDYLVRERIVHRYIDAPPFLNAFIASSLDVNSYETYAILTALLLAMLPATLYWVARTAFRLSSWASGLVAFLALCNITYHIWSFHGQLTFVAGFLFVVLAVGAGAVLVEGRGGLVFGALCLSTLLALYPALLPYALAPLLCYGCLRVWQKTLSPRAFGLTLLKVLGLLIIMNPVMVYNLAIAGFSAAGQMREDWHNISGYPSIAELLGFLPHFSPSDMEPLSRLAVFGFVPVVFGIAGYGLYRTWKDGARFLMATVAPYVFGAVIIALWMGYAYGYYKHGVVSLFAFLLAFASGVEGLWQRGWLWGRSVAILASGTFLLLNLLVLKAAYAGAIIPFVSTDLAALGAVKNLIKGDDVVFVKDEDIGSQLWTSYFLWGVSLSIPPAFEPWGWWGFSSVFGRGDARFFYHPRATYTLAKWGEITGPQPEPVWNNSTYLLHAGLPLLLLGQGWYGLEEGPPPARWMAQEGTLQLAGSGLLPRYVRLSVTLIPIVTPLTIEVFRGEERLDVFVAESTSHPMTFLTKSFPFEEEGTITIRSPAGCFEPARLFGGADHRCLSARFQNISLINMEE